MSKKYTSEQIDFIKDSYPKMTVPQLTRAFNKEFELNKSEMAIHSQVVYRKLTKEPVNPTAYLKGKKYTKKQQDFLRQGYKSKSIQTLTMDFNAKFGEERSELSIQGALNTHGLHSKRKIGMHSTRAKDIGFERICPNTGFIVTKVAEPSPYRGGQTRQRHKHKVVWEETHGPTPDGCRVRFLDGNKLNCAIENLALFTMIENMHLNHLGFNNAPDELRETIILVAKLRGKCTERKRELLETSNV